MNTTAKKYCVYSSLTARDSWTYCLHKIRLIGRKWTISTLYRRGWRSSAEFCSLRVLGGQYNESKSPWTSLFSEGVRRLYVDSSFHIFQLGLIPTLKAVWCLNHWRCTTHNTEVQFAHKHQEHKANCKIRGFHGDDYEVWWILGCYAVWLL
jgi:hypothetical protein